MKGRRGRSDSIIREVTLIACDDINATVAELEARGRAQFTQEVKDQGFGADDDVEGAGRGRRNGLSAAPRAGVRGVTRQAGTAGP